MVKIFEKNKKMIGLASSAVIIKAEFMTDGQVSLEMMSDANPKQFDFGALCDHLDTPPKIMDAGCIKLSGNQGEASFDFEKEALLIWTFSAGGVKLYISAMDETKRAAILMIAVATLYQRGWIPQQHEKQVAEFIQRIQKKIGELVERDIRQKERNAEKTTQRRKPRTEPVNTEALIEGMFEDGSAILELASEQEGTDLRYRLIGLGYRPHYTFQPQAWDDLSRYIYIEDGMAKGSDTLDDVLSADIVIPAARFLQMTEMG